MEKIIRDVGGFMAQYVGYVLTGITVFIAFLGYERVKNKDSESVSTTLAILMTKVDSLVEMNGTIKKHDEMLIRHDTEIKNLQDTNRFAKITEQMLQGGFKNV